MSSMLGAETQNVCFLRAEHGVSPEAGIIFWKCLYAGPGTDKMFFFNVVQNTVLGA